VSGAEDDAPLPNLYNNNITGAKDEREVRKGCGMERRVMTVVYQDLDWSAAFTTIRSTFLISRVYAAPTEDGASNQA
jgi:hypothetical protein